MGNPVCKMFTILFVPCIIDYRPYCLLDKYKDQTVDILMYVFSITIIMFCLSEGRRDVCVYMYNVKYRKISSYNLQVSREKFQHIFLSIATIHETV